MSRPRERAGAATRPWTREETQRICDVLESLKPHLVHTREVLDGMDFLFAGPQTDILAALRSLAALEQEGGTGARVDYARLEDFILLRVYGTGDLPEICRKRLLGSGGRPGMG
jgi:hypothetical protein